MALTEVEKGTYSKKETGFTASLRGIWRRGRERFFEPALAGAGVASAAILAAVGIHFFASSAFGVNPEVLRQAYVAVLPKAFLAGAVLGGIAGIVREYRKNEYNVRKLTEDSLFGPCIGGK